MPRPLGFYPKTWTLITKRALQPNTPLGGGFSHFNAVNHRDQCACLITRGFAANQGGWNCAANTNCLYAVRDLGHLVDSAGKVSVLVQLEPIALSVTCLGWAEGLVSSSWLVTSWRGSIATPPCPVWA